MTQIDIPFHKEMKYALLNHDKDCTSRNKKYGKPGDFFILENRKFVIDRIIKMNLIEVAHMLYKREGFTSPEKFKEYWNMLHPIKGFDPLKEVYVHFLREESV